MAAAGKRNVRAGLLGQPTKPNPRLHPDWQLHYVRQVVDGVSRDRDEAARTFAGEWWGAQARYLGWSQGLYVFERPPAGAP